MKIMMTAIYFAVICSNFLICFLMHSYIYYEVYEQLTRLFCHINVNSLIE